jgi:uncharacterized protein (TIGR02588 family)
MRAHKNILEWIVFGVSAVAIAGILAMLVTMGVTSEDRPPLLRITVGAPVAIGDAHRVPVEVKNDGGATAEGVNIEVALLSGTKVVESGELTIAFVPRGSTRKGWVTFHNDPRQFAIKARASGFNEP